MPFASAKLMPGIDAVSFSTDVVSVVALRTMRIALGGPEGMKESRLMVAEKIAALAQVQWNLITGAYGFTPQTMAKGVNRHYARAVRSNRKRLSSPRK